MSIFGDLWDGTKKIFGAIGEALVSAVFWVVDVVFDAVVKVFEWISDAVSNLIDLVGSFFATKDSPGQADILPPEAVIDVANKYPAVVAPTMKIKAKNKQAGLGIVRDGNGNIKRAQILGSDKGFGDQIKNAHDRGHSYRVPVECE